MSNLDRVARTVARLAVRHGPRLVQEIRRARALRPGAGSESRRAPGQPRPSSGRPPVASRPTDEVGKQVSARTRLLQYSPDLDGQADPGEVVWTLVPYEEDPSRGKDRPVLVVGRDGSSLLGLMLSSQSERDGQRDWLRLGTGSWDSEGRPSWVRLDRVLTVEETGIRREGAVLERSRFDEVAKVLRQRYGWR